MLIPQFYLGTWEEKMPYLNPEDRIKPKLCLCCHKHKVRRMYFCEVCLTSPNSLKTHNRRLRIIIDLGLKNQNFKMGVK